MQGRELEFIDVSILYENKFRGKVRMTGPFYGFNKPCLQHCSECSTTWSQNPKYVLMTKLGCVNCGRKVASPHLKKTDAQYNKELKAKRPDLVCLGTYSTTDTKLLHRHTCGHEWQALPWMLLKGRVGSCPACRKIPDLRSFKRVRLGKRDFKVQGYEGKVLEWLHTEKKIPLKDLVVATTGKVPVVRYYFKGKTRIHFPDILVKTHNTLIEVKSLYTLGLKGNDEWLRQNRAKSRAAAKAGQNYRIVVVTQGGEVSALPEDWFTKNKTYLTKVTS